MRNFIVFVSILISLNFLLLIRGHPVPHCPCKFRSSHGSHSYIFPSSEITNIQESVAPVSRPEVHYRTLLMPQQTMVQDFQPISQTVKQSIPCARSQYSYSIIPTAQITQSQPANPPEPVTVEIPMSRVIQTRILESPMPQFDVEEENSQTSCQSDELTGRALDFHVEPAAVSRSNEVEFKTYNTGIQSIIPKSSNPVVRTGEQQISSLLMVQPQPTYIVQERAPQCATQISSPFVKEATSRTSYTEELPPNPLQHMFFHSHKPSCSCSKK